MWDLSIASKEQAYPNTILGPLLCFKETFKAVDPIQMS